MAGFVQSGQTQLMFETNKQRYQFHYAFGSNDNAAAALGKNRAGGDADVDLWHEQHTATGELVRVLPAYQSKAYPVHARCIYRTAINRER